MFFTRFSLGAKLSTFFIVLIIISTLNLGLIFGLSKESADSFARVNGMVDITALGNELLISLIDAETGQRGYILTGKESYLEPYYTGSKEALVTLAKLKRLAPDSALSLRDLENIEDLARKKLAELEQTVELYRAGNRDGALKIVSSDIGKEFMDELRKHIADFGATSKTLFRESRRDLSSLQRLTRILLLSETVIFVVVMMVLYYLIRKSVVNPLHRLTTAVRRHRVNDAFAPVDIAFKDEIGDLTEAYNELGARFYSTASGLAASAAEANDAKEKAYLDSVTDSLTGLNNRRYLEIMAPKLLSSARRHKHELGFLMIDVDRFKAVNDSYGHATGDAVLAEIGKALRDEIRVSDLVVRYGGEEFLLILDHTGLELAQQKAEHIRSILAARHIPELGDKRITVSVGVAQLGNDDESIDQAIRRADEALYKAKNSGRNCWRSCC